MPRDPTKFNKKIEDFDPSILFEIEYAKDAAKAKAYEEKLFGPRPDVEEVMIVEVKHFKTKMEPTIMDELKATPKKEFGVKNEIKSEIKDESSMVSTVIGPETNFKREEEKKKYSELLRRMQEFGNKLLNKDLDESEDFFLKTYSANLRPKNIVPLTKDGKGKPRLK